MNASFLSLSSPPLVSMIQCRTSGECIEKIRLSLSEGAEAFGVQLCQLAREERTEENFSAVFRACENKPIYVTSYRYNLNIGLSDEECTDLLIKARLAGATLLDVPADWFDANECQVTDNPEAVEKQKELIAKLHGMGAEVLLSTHDLRDLSTEEIFSIARKQAERGADILKIVVKSESADRLPEYISVIHRVKQELRKPFLFLDCGACSSVLRRAGGILGSCMYLCVAARGELDTPVQPTLRQVKAVRAALSEQ